MLGRMMRLGKRLLQFAIRVLLRFNGHQGWQLSAALAFHALLSVIPLAGLVLVIVSHLIDPTLLLTEVTTWVDMAVPQAADPINHALSDFLEERALASVVGAGAVLFFSAMAFRTLDGCLSAIFETEEAVGPRRHAFQSLVIPLFLMGVVIAALVVLSLLVSALDVLPQRSLLLGGVEFSLAAASRRALQAVGFVALVAHLAAFYRLMPEAHVRLKHALIGALVASLLWEAMRRTLAWYYGSVSMVGLIYGSLTTVVVLLLTFQTGAAIVLLGGEVIAEFTRCERAGRPWHEDPARPAR